MDLLSHLAQFYGTDKWGVHSYTPYYDSLFRHTYGKLFSRVMEIGVLNGASLRMWQAYFPHALVVGVDINSNLIHEPRIKCIQANQRDGQAMKEIAEEYGPFDIVIDDASHEPEDQAFTANVIFPFINHFYIIEDVREGNKEKVQAAINYPTRVVEFDIQRQTDDRLIICER